MQYGRQIIYTDEIEITEDNIMSVIDSAITIHKKNAEDVTELLELDANNIPKWGEKLTRTDIDFWVPLSLPSVISKFWMDFDWGNPITLVQRGEKDTGTLFEPEAIAIVNEYFDAQFIRRKSQELGRFVTITGIGYTIDEINAEWEDGESPFTSDVLDPRFCFVVRSSAYTDHRIILGVTYREKSNGDRYYTCYTDKRRFLIECIEGNTEIKTEINPINRIPIVEWIRDYDRMGCFERQIPEIKAISRMISDTVNQQNQNTNSLWHGNDVEFPKDDKGNLKYPGNNDWILTETTRDGKQPFIKPIILDYNYEGTLNEIIALINTVLIEANVPQRNDNSGGSTGIAMADATGWTHAEAEASRHDQIKADCKAEEIKIIIAIMNATKIATIPDSVKKLRWIDCKANIKRQKNYEMITKINTYATGVSHGLSPQHMIEVINMFDDPNQTYEDSKPTIERYLDSIFDVNSNESDTENKLQADLSDQITNSPNIDGMSTNQEVE